MVDDIKRTAQRSGWQIGPIIRYLGLKHSAYFDWQKRAREGRLVDKKIRRARLNKLLPEEEQIIIRYALTRPKEGYRRLAWMMVDKDVVCASPGTVYNVLSRHDLLYRWKRTERSEMKVEKPTGPNQRWHTDIMYLWVSGRWYFFVGVIDGYSRYVVHWELLVSMRADEVSLVVLRALEKNPEAHPEIVNDHGTQFTSRDFKALIKRFELTQIKTRLHHPESNGVIERFHRSLREELSERELKDLGSARMIISQWVDYYNEKRLHAGIEYLRPADYHYGKPEKLLRERRQKLSRAREHRRVINLSNLMEVNHSKENLLKSPIFS